MIISKYRLDPLFKYLLSRMNSFNGSNRLKYWKGTHGAFLRNKSSVSLLSLLGLNEHIQSNHVSTVSMLRDYRE
jgi:hypothetical protein